MLSGVAQGGTALHSQRYHLLPADLRISPSEMLGPMLCSPINAVQGLILDPSLPTLLLFECVLAYIAPSASSHLLDWFIKFIQRSPTGVLGCVVYEMFGLNDSFGRVMINNLRVSLIISIYPVLEVTVYLGEEYLYTRRRALSRRTESSKQIFKCWFHCRPCSHT